ncbi:PoNe immunity protein domain-containing protein [Metabacillus fastidiosus]|uniref:DUF1911 domain-containing protein n=1 Tax=Metabacillus fastidiosus TaxID=1458 RepID=A0ABU6NXI7_9BACI|nr:DUF1911 domain-containing protein [Metabacillus fastidiosus]
MVRDNIKDEKYFDYFIIDENKRINKFENMIKKVIDERGEDDEGVRSAYNYLYGIYFSKLKALYSAGRSFNEIKDYLSDVLEIMDKNWDQNSGYVEMVWMLSIGIMLDVQEKEMGRLIKLVRKSEIKDYLIEFLIHSYDNRNEIVTENCKWETPYGFLVKVINEKDKEESVRLLKEYLEKKWYPGHGDMGWYDTHEIKDDYIYSGYWSFESGAIVKILRLDDHMLKEVPYYPYDMRHYKE